MSRHRRDVPEERAAALLREIVAIDRQDRDALPGMVVHHVKTALKILNKRRNRDPVRQ